MLKKIFIFLLIIVCLSQTGTVLAAAGDPWFKYQIYLDQVGAIDAWRYVNQSPNVTVAIIDSGVDIDHPDLFDNIWRNTDEVAGDGIDNDKNGFIDDVNGWDFLDSTPDPRPKFSGEFSKLGINHGTLVAGIIGAVGNNGLGITGVSWKIKLMSLRVMNGLGEGSTDIVIKAINYAVDNGADIINLSMVGSIYDSRLEETIAKAYERGLIIVASAGNESVGSNNTDVSLNLSLTPQYPICHDGPNGENHVLGIGAVDFYDVKSVLSNYGSKCVDLMAPGENFFGVLFFSPMLADYSHYYGGYWSGTSLSAPLVAGAAALIKTIRPDLFNKDIYDLLKKTADDISFRNSNYNGMLGAGRLNINSAVIEALKSNPLSGAILTVDSTGREISIFATDGSLKSSFKLDKKIAGRILSVITVDYNFDGQKEIITAVKKATGTYLVALDKQGKVLKDIKFFDNLVAPTGATIVSGDFNNDSQPEIAAAPLSGGKPILKIFDYAGKTLKEISLWEKNFRGGTELAVTDFELDGVMEIACASGAGRKGEVRIYDSFGKELLSFEPNFKNTNAGLKIFTADLFGNAETEILIVPKNLKTKDTVKIFNLKGELQTEWQIAEKISSSLIALQGSNGVSGSSILFIKNSSLLFYSAGGGEPRQLPVKNLKNPSNIIFY